MTAVRNGTAAEMLYGLTAYEATYVDLAVRENLILASLNTAMLKAAEQPGIVVFK